MKHETIHWSDLEAMTVAAARAAAREVIGEIPRPATAGQIARALVPEKREVPKIPFSFAYVANAMLTDQWGKRSCYEKEVMTALGPLVAPGTGEQLGLKIPPSALYGKRDMTAAGASGSQYLVATEDLGYLAALQPASWCMQLGAQRVPVGSGSMVLPLGTAAVSTYWSAGEAAAITESQPSFGQVASEPKILGAYIEVSHQLLKQSNADEHIVTELVRGAGTELDRVIIQGTGLSGEPRGLVNTGSIGGFVGTSLAPAGLRNAVKDVLHSNSNVGGRLAFIATPTIAELLSTRQRFSGSSTACWEGSLADGVVEGERAVATTNCPASSMLFADWSTVAVLEWPGSVGIAIDPFTKFNYGLVGFRLLFAVDVLVTRPSAVSLATSIT